MNKGNMEKVQAKLAIFLKNYFYLMTTLTEREREIPGATLSQKKLTSLLRIRQMSTSP